MTRIQAETKEFIENFLLVNNRRPTVRELQRHFKLSAVSSAHERFKLYEKTKENCPYCNRKLNVK